MPWYSEKTQTCFRSISSKISCWSCLRIQQILLTPSSQQIRIFRFLLQTQPPDMDDISWTKLGNSWILFRSICKGRRMDLFSRTLKIIPNILMSLDCKKQKIIFLNVFNWPSYRQNNYYFKSRRKNLDCELQNLGWQLWCMEISAKARESY